MILATKLSVIKKICSAKTLQALKNIYVSNNLNYTFKKYSKKSSIRNLIPFLKNDKKNNDNNINFILLKKIGKTALPNAFKMSVKEIKKNCKTIAQC